MFCTKLLRSMFCCSNCPCSTSSAITRTTYATSTVLALILCITVPKLNITQDLPFCTPQYSDCLSNHSFLFIYRCCFGMSTFYFCMSLMMVFVTSSKDVRAGLQNGFWVYKIGVICALCYGAMFIPAGHFDECYMFIGLIASVFFHVFQSVFFSQIGYLVGILLERFFLRRGRQADFLIYALSFLLMAVAVITSVHPLMIYPQCNLNTALIFTHIGLCVFAYLLCIIVGRSKPPKFIQSGVMSLYIAVLTFSAISNNPDHECRWVSVGHIVDYANYAAVFLWLTCHLIVILHPRKDHVEPSEHTIVITMETNLFCNTCGTVKIVDIRRFQRSVSDSLRYRDVVYESTDDNEDEFNQVRYSWCVSHLSLCSAILYIMVSTTNWYVPGWAERPFMWANEPAMWFKVVSCWFCVVAYVLLITLGPLYEVHPR